MLSLSFFRDEAAVAAWRNTEDHRRAQAAGRGGVFRDYRLRVAEVVRDYGMTERAEVPTDSRAAHRTQSGAREPLAVRPIAPADARARP